MDDSPINVGDPTKLTYGSPAQAYAIVDAVHVAIMKHNAENPTYIGEYIVYIGRQAFSVLDRVNSSYYCTYIGAIDARKATILGYKYVEVTRETYLAVHPTYGVLHDCTAG